MANSYTSARVTRTKSNRGSVTGLSTIGTPPKILARQRYANARKKRISAWISSFSPLTFDYIEILYIQTFYE